VLLAGATIAVGLFTHLVDIGLASAARDVIGDALWACMMMWFVSAALPSLPVVGRAAIALSVCYLVETSQLYHAPWIDSIRATLPGHLLLGSGFDWRDRLSYAAGVLIGVVFDRLFRRADFPDA
jgi:hypothetical protein